MLTDMKDTDQNERIPFTERFRCGVLLLTLLMVAGQTLGKADDWPQFRGPNRDGKATERGLLSRWPDGGPQLLWSVAGVGQGFSHVAVSGGLVYVTGLEGKEGMLRAYTLDGKPKWQGSYGPEWSASHPGARSIPTVYAGLVYVASGMGNVACFDGTNGRLVWSAKLFERYEAPQIQWGYAESLLADGDRIFCTPCGKQATMVALNRKTGEPIWASPALGQGSSFCSPLLVEHGKQRMIVTMTENAVRGSVLAGTGHRVMAASVRERSAEPSDHTNLPWRAALYHQRLWQGCHWVANWLGWEECNQAMGATQAGSGPRTGGVGGWLCLCLQSPESQRPMVLC